MFPAGHGLEARPEIMKHGEVVWDGEKLGGSADAVL